MRADQMKVYYRVDYIDVLNRRFVFETEAVKPDEALRNVVSYLDSVYGSRDDEVKIEKYEKTHEMGIAILSTGGFLLATALAGARVDYEKWKPLEV